MVMQDMHPLVEWQDPRPDSSPVGTSTFRNRRPEDHHGKVRVATSGTNLRALTGPTAIAPVQTGASTLCCPSLISARGYRDLTQGFHDLNLRVGNIDDRTQQIQGTLNQHFEDTVRHHTQQQTNHNAMMELLQKQYNESQAFYRFYGCHPGPGQ